MKVLVVGSGGREHALAWKISRSPLVREVICAPGNPGTAQVGTNVDIPVSDIDGLLELARNEGIALTVVGPEQPLVDGLADRFRAAGLAVFGPGTDGAVLEGSKVYAKDFMDRHGIPTAAFRAFTDAQDAMRALQSGDMPVPVVVKADGLAAGKGVLICETREQALDAVSVVMEQQAFGAAGASIVMEEFLTGFEASVHMITDGTAYRMLPTARDHKKIYDGDRGPNTGGMGAVSPAPGLDESLEAEIREQIIEPFMDGLAADDIAFKGVVFFGLMIGAEGPRVLEFNVRFGDPETQVLLPRMDSDLVPVLMETAMGRLESDVSVIPDTAVAVVAASEGYPGAYQKNRPVVITGAMPAGTTLFHAGTSISEGSLKTSGGRVLAVTGMGADIDAARAAAYDALATVEFEGMTYRKDIALLH